MEKPPPYMVKTAKQNRLRRAPSFRSSACTGIERKKTNCTTKKNQVRVSPDRQNQKSEAQKNLTARIEYAEERNNDPPPPERRSFGKIISGDHWGCLSSIPIPAVTLTKRIPQSR